MPFTTVPQFVLDLKTRLQELNFATIWNRLRRDQRLLMLLFPSSLARPQQPLFGKYLFYNTLWSNDLVPIDKLTITDVPWCQPGLIHRLSTRYWIDTPTGEVMEPFHTIVNVFLM